MVMSSAASASSSSGTTTGVFGAKFMSSSSESSEMIMSSRLRPREPARKTSKSKRQQVFKGEMGSLKDGECQLKINAKNVFCENFGDGVENDDLDFDLDIEKVIQ